MKLKRLLKSGFGFRSSGLATETNPSNRSSQSLGSSQTCQNCSADLIGAYCHGCGQSGSVHRSFAREIAGIIQSIISLDSKTIRTILFLFFRPGTLTRSFVYGKRARFAPPFSSFIASVFFVFGFFGLFVGPNYFKEREYTKSELLESAREGLDEAIATQKDGVITFQKLKRAAPSSTTPEEIQRALKGLDLDQKRVDRMLRRIELIKAMPDQPGVGKGDPLGLSYTYKGQSVLAEDTSDLIFEIDAARTLVGDEIGLDGLDATAKAIRLLADQNLSLKMEDRLGAALTIMAPQGFRLATPWPALNDRVNPHIRRPIDWVKRFTGSASKFAILIVPISLPFIVLLFAWKRDSFIYDHVVFTLYASASLVMLFIGFTILAHWIAWADLIAPLLLIYSVHLFWHLKEAYDLRVGTAFGLTAVFSIFFAPITMALFVTSVVFLSAL